MTSDAIIRGAVYFQYKIYTIKLIVLTHTVSLKLCELCSGVTCVNTRKLQAERSLVTRRPCQG